MFLAWLSTFRRTLTKIAIKQCLSDITIYVFNHKFDNVYTYNRNDIVLTNLFLFSFCLNLKSYYSVNTIYS